MMPVCLCRALHLPLRRCLQPCNTGSVRRCNRRSGVHATSAAPEGKPLQAGLGFS